MAGHTLGRPGAPAIGQRQRRPLARPGAGCPPWAALRLWGFPVGTLHHEVWEMMADLEADEALVFVEMEADYALLWFPTERAAATALLEAHNGGRQPIGRQPMLNGQTVWLRPLWWGD